MHEDAETEARVAEAVHREAAQWLREVDGTGVVIPVPDDSRLRPPEVTR